MTPCTGGSGYDFFAFDVQAFNILDRHRHRFQREVRHDHARKGIFKVAASSEGGDVVSCLLDRIARLTIRATASFITRARALLYYDPDGTGSKAAQQFAMLDKNLKMTYKDFLIF